MLATSFLSCETNEATLYENGHHKWYFKDIFTWTRLEKAYGRSNFVVSQKGCVHSEFFLASKVATLRTPYIMVARSKAKDTFCFLLSSFLLSTQGNSSVPFHIRRFIHVRKVFRQAITG